jgi:hypothetical protein
MIIYLHLFCITLLVIAVLIPEVADQLYGRTFYAKKLRESGLARVVFHMGLKDLIVDPGAFAAFL